tara:strand:- start:2378 stop:2593 length:216 start_codon:yes stop_codon:yes gene_type:complete
MNLGGSSKVSIQYPKIKININGKVVSIEKEQDDFWKSNSKLITLFEELLKILNVQEGDHFHYSLITQTSKK